MIRTTIITDFDGRKPIYHPSAGLAKSLAVADWLFTLTGWQYPADLCYEVGAEPADAPYGEHTELWVLENRLHMN